MKIVVMLACFIVSIELLSFTIATKIILHTHLINCDDVCSSFNETSALFITTHKDAFNLLITSFYHVVTDSLYCLIKLVTYRRRDYATTITHLRLMVPQSNPLPECTHLNNMRYWMNCDIEGLSDGLGNNTVACVNYLTYSATELSLLSLITLFAMILYNCGTLLVH